MRGTFTSGASGGGGGTRLVCEHHVRAVGGCADTGQSDARAELKHVRTSKAVPVRLYVPHQQPAYGPQQRVQPLVRPALRYAAQPRERARAARDEVRRAAAHRYSRPAMHTLSGGGTACARRGRLSAHVRSVKATQGCSNLRRPAGRRAHLDVSV